MDSYTRMASSRRASCSTSDLLIRSRKLYLALVCNTFRLCNESMRSYHNINSHERPKSRNSCLIPTQLDCDDKIMPWHFLTFVCYVLELISLQGKANQKHTQTLHKTAAVITTDWWHNDFDFRITRLLNPRDVSNFQARAQKRSKKPYFLWEAMS